MKKIVIALCLLALILAGVSYYTYNNLMTIAEESVTLDDSQRSYLLKPGTSMRSLGKDLYAKNIISSDKAWDLWVKKNAKGRTIKTGEYALPEQATIAGLMELFIAGKVVQYKFTIVEGQTFKDVLNNLAKHDAVEQSLSRDTFVADFKEWTGEDFPEGWLFPETYFHPNNMSDKKLIVDSYQLTKSTLEELWESRQPDLPLASPYEALILASIVEKETGVAEERPRIAGVFINRLRKKMLLQTDPTVIYGMGDRYDGNIRKRDLKEKTAYNTYVIKGLPPTPIASPGREAIAAVLQPEENDYIFFVAKGDRSGEHYFSKTYAEHKKAVRKFQLNR